MNWHSGWRDPEEYIPPLDCDPFIGACSEVSCMCDGFVTWEHEGGIYVYNPRLVNPETELCSNCHHSKKSHHLRSKTLQFPEDRRRMLKEYSSEILEKYGIPEGTMQQDEGSTLGNRRHPSEVPQYELQRFYDQHPDFPGASERLKGFSLSETISDDQQVGSGASNKKKSSVMGMMMDDVDDGFGDGFGEDDDLL